MISVNLNPKGNKQRCFENEDDLRGFGDNLCSSVETNNAIYDKYAAIYDNFIEMTGFNDSHEIVKYIAKNDVEKSAEILDMGCGSGVVGVLLHNLGYKCLAGYDGSQEMVKVAESKGVYKWVKQALVGIDQLDDLCQFDIIVSSATMIKGHFPSNCYTLTLPLLKKGGHLIFSIRDKYLDPKTDEGMGYQKSLNDIESLGAMKLKDKLNFTKYQGLDFGKGFWEEPAKVLVHEKL